MNRCMLNLCDTLLAVLLWSREGVTNNKFSTHTQKNPESQPQGLAFSKKEKKKNIILMLHRVCAFTSYVG